VYVWGRFGVKIARNWNGKPAETLNRLAGVIADSRRQIDVLASNINALEDIYEDDRSAEEQAELLKCYSNKSAAE
jgi:hypothetical protein